MKQFALYNPTTLTEAAELLGADPPRTRLLAGGMDLLGRMKFRVDAPERVVNLKSIPGLDAIRETSEGLSLGPLVKLTDLAESPVAQKNYRALAQAAESVGSVQIRNSGTVGGNLCQHPRCWYYRHPDFPCLQKGGPICYAQGGENRYHAILGGGPCFFAHPSDLAPALIALDASAHIVGPKGERTVALEKLYRLPMEQLGVGLALEPGEIVGQIRVPAPKSETRSTYLKFKERPSFDFSLVGVAASLVLDGRKISAARLALSGVAPVPWRAVEAEKVLVGSPLDEATARKAAELVVEGSVPLLHNRYKISLTRTMVRRALLSLA
ncbi:MAG: xanthine dehydrogenase family protein subunit M [Acidobacteriia bacterium]|nr:xanthine dehydrogenase family protein subunit M [Terriglobia bacterium]